MHRQAGPVSDIAFGYFDSSHLILRNYTEFEKDLRNFYGTAVVYSVLNFPDSKKYFCFRLQHNSFYMLRKKS